MPFVFAGTGAGQGGRAAGLQGCFALPERPATPPQPHAHCTPPPSRHRADVRMAAAVALAEGTELHPQVVAAALEQTIALYSGAVDNEAARAGACGVAPHSAAPPRLPARCWFEACALGPVGRLHANATCSRPEGMAPLDPVLCSAGTAVALQALAPGLSADQLPAALEFLLSCGLADGSSLIREGMIAAGGLQVAVVEGGQLLACAHCVLHLCAPSCHGIRRAGFSSLFRVSSLACSAAAGNAVVDNVVVLNFPVLDRPGPAAPAHIRRRGDCGRPRRRQPRGHAAAVRVVPRQKGGVIRWLAGGRAASAWHGQPLLSGRWPQFPCSHPSSTAGRL